MLYKQRLYIYYTKIKNNYIFPDWKHRIVTQVPSCQNEFLNNSVSFIPKPTII